MASSDGQNQVRGHLEEKVPEKQGLLGGVLSSLNFTKYLGFVSDLDSPANQAVLAAMREREEREGVTEEVPQAPLSERVMQGVTNVANTASVIATSAAGGVAPRGQESPEQAKSVTGDSHGHRESNTLSSSGGKGQKLAHPTSNVSGISSDKGQEFTNAPTPKQSERQQERFLLHKGHDAEPAEKDGHSFSKWAVRAAHKLGHAVASKDLTDDTSLDKKSRKT